MESSQINSNYSWLDDTSKLILSEKFFKSFPSYDKDQAPLNQAWEKVNITASPEGSFTRQDPKAIKPEWANLLRKGLACNKFRAVVLELFIKTKNNNSLEYNTAENVAFKSGFNSLTMNIPFFSEIKSLDTAVPMNFLNEKGVEALKKIMWIFQKNTPRLEYSPMLPTIVSILLIFMKEEEVFTVTKTMLEDSDKTLNLSNTQNMLKKMRWHVTFKREQFAWTVDHVASFCKQRSDSFLKLENHFTKINYDFKELFKIWLRTLFVDFLPISLVLKIFGAYLNEGIKIYFKFISAVLKIFRADILGHQDPQTMTDMLREKMRKVNSEQAQALLGKAYKKRFAMTLKKKLIKHKGQASNIDEAITHHYAPDMSEPSKIITHQQLETLWGWVPHSLRHTHLKLIYSPRQDGWGLRAFYRKMESVYSHNTLLLIKDTNNNVFGAFADTVLAKKGKLEEGGSQDCFVFQLSPKRVRYRAEGRQSGGVLCDSEYLSIGSGGGGSAIYLKGDLHSGLSNKSETYNNLPLVEGENGSSSVSFECHSIEVYLLE